MLHETDIPLHVYTVSPKTVYRDCRRSSPPCNIHFDNNKIIFCHELYYYFYKLTSVSKRIRKHARTQTYYYTKLLSV